MGSVFKNRQINSYYGIFFQITVFMIGAFGLSKLVKMFYYSLTEFDLLTVPSFIGFKNYSGIFKEYLVQKCFGNTVVMVCIVAVLLLLTAVLPAVFIARLKLPFGIGVAGAFSVISFSVMLPNFLNTFLSEEYYGILNGILLNNSVINEPITFAQSHGKLLAVIIMWLYCLAPAFLITYIAARMNHSFLGAAIVVCSIPVLMYNGGSIITSVVGYPSADYSADWFYTIFNDYLMVRYEIGFAYAILFVGLIMLICWCLIVCALTYGLWWLCKKVEFNFLDFKVCGYITFSLALLLFFVVLSYIIMYLLRAFMPIDELLVYPNNIYIPKKPTLKNFSDLFELSASFTPFARYILNSIRAVPLVIMPVCFLVALPSGVGFGLFNSFKRQNLLLLCFIPFLFTHSYITLSELGIIDSYLAYMFKFLSSFEFLIVVFLVYLATKLVFYDSKLRISSILLGIFFIISSFYAIGAIRGIWHSSNDIIYSEQMKTWRDVSAYISLGGITRSGIAAANDILMLLATMAVVIIPSVLLLTLYLLYQKNTKRVLP